MRVSSSDDQRGEDGSVHTSAFPFDLDDEFDGPSGAAERWAEGLPGGSALLVVNRGHNAGARFL
jgi:hypothetical protein